MTRLPRTLANAGWANPRELPRGPNGKFLCRFCSTEVQGRRLTFCSGSRARFGHDGGIVEGSGQGCVHEHLVRSDSGYARKCVYARDRGECAACKAVVPRHGYWEADYIVPVAEGGGSCGLENLRTLCVPCHKLETKALAKRRAEARRIASAKEGEIFPQYPSTKEESDQMAMKSFKASVDYGNERLEANRRGHP